VEILLWLVPPVVVTVVAMVWVGWLGREGRGQVDREEAVRRLGAALERPQAPPAPRLPSRRLRSTGVALRRTPRTTLDSTAESPAKSPTESPAEQQRRAS
jgi:hypothetical protein